MLRRPDLVGFQPAPVTGSLGPRNRHLLPRTEPQRRPDASRQHPSVNFGVSVVTIDRDLAKIRNAKSTPSADHSPRHRNRELTYHNRVKGPTPPLGATSSGRVCFSRSSASGLWKLPSRQPATQEPKRHVREIQTASASGCDHRHPPPPCGGTYHNRVKPQSTERMSMVAR